MAAHLGTPLLASADASIDDALRMLQAPVHWVLHGEYRAHDPLASFVVLGDRRPRELPA
ncbi:MAG TPA: hypothetical protein PLB97_10170 [Accumulibacter sp.]|nr:hypothetical protein [Accumulibacter sp.]